MEKRCGRSLQNAKNTTHLELGAFLHLSQGRSESLHETAGLQKGKKSHERKARNPIAYLTSSWKLERGALSTQQARPIPPPPWLDSGHELSSPPGKCEKGRLDDVFCCWGQNTQVQIMAMLLMLLTGWVTLKLILSFASWGLQWYLPHGVAVRIN